MNHLQGQVTSLKGQLRGSSQSRTVARTSRSQPRRYAAKSQPAQKTVYTSTEHIAANVGKPHAQEAKLNSGYYTFGHRVIIAPFTGIPTYFDGHQLLVNSPSINEDLKLLGRRQMAEAGSKRTVVDSSRSLGQGFVLTHPLRREPGQNDLRPRGSATAIIPRRVPICRKYGRLFPSDRKRSSAIAGPGSCAESR